MVGDERGVDGIGDGVRVDMREMAFACVDDGAVICPGTAVEGVGRGHSDGAVARAARADGIEAVERAVVLDGSRGPRSIWIALVDDAVLVEDMADLFPWTADMRSPGDGQVYTSVEEVVVAVVRKNVRVVCLQVALIRQWKRVCRIVDPS